MESSNFSLKQSLLDGLSHVFDGLCFGYVWYKHRKRQWRRPPKAVPLQRKRRLYHRIREVGPIPQRSPELLRRLRQRTRSYCSSGEDTVDGRSSSECEDAVEQMFRCVPGEVEISTKFERAVAEMDSCIPVMRCLVVRCMNTLPVDIWSDLKDLHYDLCDEVEKQQGRFSHGWDQRLVGDNAVVLERLEQVRKGLSSARALVNECEVDERELLLERLRVFVNRCRSLKARVNSIGRRATEQMDAFESQVMGVVSECAAPVLKAVGSRLSARFGGRHDSPAIPDNSPGNIAASNLPKKVAALSFKAEDFTGSSHANFSQDPSVDVCDLVGRCQIPALLRQIPWVTTAPVGTELLYYCQNDLGYPMKVTPVQPYKQRWNGTVVQQYNTPMSYFGDFFMYWRGSIEFTFEVVATRFHQGQLFIAFVPGKWLTGLTLENCRNCVSATIDLSASNRTKLVVPFISQSDYKWCVTGTGYHDGSTWVTPYNNVDDGFAGDIGILNVYVQNPLTAPVNVSSEVTVNLYIAAGKDFEFAVPKAARMSQNINVSGTRRVREVDPEMAEQMETIVAVATAPPVHKPISGLVPQTEDQVATNCDVAAASMTTIAERTYLLQTGLSWTTSTPQFYNMFHAPVSGLFRSSSIAIRGMLHYHAYMRSNFEVTVRFNAAPFFCGQLILYWHPLQCNNEDISAPSLTQLPHAFLNPATDTSATIQIPWSLYSRTTYTDSFIESDTLGYVNIMVWNTLRPAQGGTQDLKGTLWGRFISPYIGVKTGIVTEGSDLTKYTEQMGDNPTDPSREPTFTQGASDFVGAPIAAVCRPVDAVSDGAAGRSTGGDPFVPLDKREHSGHIRSWHANARDLLKRPACLHQTTLHVNAPRTDMLRLCELGMWGGYVHDAIRTTYLGWSGTIRYTIVTNAGATDKCLLGISPLWQVRSTNATRERAGDLGSYYTQNGMILWNTSTEPIKTVSIPFYYDLPAAPNPMASDYGATPCNHSQVNLVCDYSGFNDEMQQNMRVMIFMSAGDDFELYVPLQVPWTMFYTNSSPLTNDLLSPGSKSRRTRTAPQAQEQMLRIDPGQFSPTSDFRELNLAEVDREVSRLSKIMAPMQALCGFLRWIMDKLRAGATYISMQVMAQRIKAAQDGVMSKILPILTWVLDFIVNLYCLFSETTATCKALALTALTAKCATAYIHGAELLEQLTKATEQIGILDVLGSYTNIAGLVATAMVAGLLSLLGYGIASSDARSLRDTATWKFGEVCAVTSKVASGVGAVPKLWLAASNGIKTGLEYFLEGKSMFTTWYDTRREVFAEWQRNVDDDYLSGRFDNNNAFGHRNGESNYQRLMEHAAVATEIRAHQGGVDKFPVTWSRTAETVLQDAARVRKAFEYANGRVEPVGIYVQGHAGSGKSLAWTKFFPYIIMKKAGLVTTFEEAKRQTFSKPTDPNQRFMDGYMAQKWVGVDDFGASSTDEDAVEMINLISVSNCPVNMADLTEKKTLFTSLFICATTNQSSTQAIVSLRDKSALKRRFPFPVCQTVKTDFEVNGKLNVAKLQDEMQACSTVDDWLTLADKVWSFRVLDINNGSVGNVISANRLVERIVDCYKTRSRLNDTMDDVMAQLQMNVELSQGDFVPMRRLSPDTYFCDARSEPEIISTPVLIRRAKLMARSWKAYTRGELDKSTGRQFLDVVRTEYREYGFISREEFDTVLRTSAPAVLSESRSYVGDEPGRFYAWMRMLYDIPGTVLTDGPPPKPWKGLMPVLLEMLGLAVGAAAIAYGIYRFFKAYVFKSLDAVEQGPEYTGEKRYVRTTAKGHRVEPRIRRVATAVEQTGDEVEKKLRKSIRTLQFYVGSEPRGHVRCVALDSQHLLVNAHFWKAVEIEEADGKEVTVFLRQVNHRGADATWHPITTDPSLRRRLLSPGYSLGADAMVVRLVGVQVFHARSVWHHFVRDKDIEEMYGSKYMCKRIQDENSVSGVWDSAAFIQGFKYQEMDNLYGEAKMNEDSLDGYCGMPYLLSNERLTHRVFGIHSLKTGYCSVGVCLVSYEQLIDARRYLDDSGVHVATEVEPLAIEQYGEVREIVTHMNLNWDVPDMEILGQLVIGKHYVDKYSPERTAFEKSGLNHPEWSDNYLPAQHSAIHVDGDLVIPLFKNVQKFGNEMAESVPLDIHQEAIWHFQRKIPWKQGVVLNWDEAINGVEPMQPLAMDTSTGYLVKFFKNGKRELFDPIPQKSVDGVLQKQQYVFSKIAASRKIPYVDKTFVEMLEWQDQCLNSGKEPFMLWTATLKDELLKKPKVAIGKTRVFVQPGVDYTLHMRRYFGDFCNLLKMRPGFKFHHLIGVEKDAVWKEVYQTLREMDSHFDLDFSNYDGTVCGLAFDFFRRVTDYYYGPAHQKARHVLLHNLQHSTIVVGQECVLVHQGNKSGNPLTDIFNSLTNVWLMYISFLLENRKRGGEYTLASFENFVRFLTYGDDVILGVKSQVREWFNRETVAYWASGLGMVATDAAKSDKIVKYNDLSELTFLKSRYVPVAESGSVTAVLAPLPVEVIHREIMWQRKTNAGDVTILQQRVRTAILMMCHHGKEKTDEFVAQLQEIGLAVTFDWQLWFEGLKEKQKIGRLDDKSGLEDPELMDIWENPENRVEVDDWIMSEAG